MVSFLCFSLGLLIGSAALLRRGLAEILAFVLAPIGLVILIHLTVNSFGQGSEAVISFSRAGVLFVWGLAAGVILAGIPYFFSLSGKLTHETSFSFDRWLSSIQFTQWISSIGRHGASHAEKTTLYYATAIKLGALVSMADGKAERSEFSALCTVFNIRDTTTRDAKKIYLQQVQSPETLKEIIRPFLRAFGSKSSHAETLIYGMAKIALADEQSDPKEVALIWEAAKALRVPTTDAIRILSTAGILVNGQDGTADSTWDTNFRNALRGQPLTVKEQHLAMLGLRANASRQEIRKAWRKLAAKYHPDKLAGRKLPPDELEKAEEMMKKINAAYDWLSH